MERAHDPISPNLELIGAFVSQSTVICPPELERFAVERWRITRIAGDARDHDTTVSGAGHPCLDGAPLAPGFGPRAASYVQGTAPRCAVRRFEQLAELGHVP